MDKRQKLEKLVKLFTLKKSYVIKDITHLITKLIAAYSAIELLYTRSLEKEKVSTLLSSLYDYNTRVNIPDSILDGYTNYW